jgi:hypothetical protein
MIMSMFHNVPAVPCEKMEHRNACVAARSFALVVKKHAANAPVSLMEPQ